MARAKTEKKSGLNQKQAVKRHNLLMLAVFLVFVVLAISGLEILSHRTLTEVGQFQPGTTYAGENFSRSLDLKVAAKNKYPSSALVTVKDLGAVNGDSQKLVSFSVPVDGLTEYGLLMLPGSPQPPQGYPAVILCHGYVNPTLYHTEAGYIADMQFYAENGFAVIKPDFRGQGFSINEGQADSAFYSMAYNTDIMSLISSLKDTKYIDKSNISLWGHSMGAYLAFRASVLSPDIKNLILLSAPVDSLSKMYLSYIPSSDENNLDALKTRQDVFNKYGTPINNTVFWRNSSPINLISRIKAHIQINVGSLDQTVPPDFSADLDSALSRANIKHEYYVYPDGQHSLVAQRALIWQRSLQLLQSAASSPARV